MSQAAVILTLWLVSAWIEAGVLGLPLAWHVGGALAASFYWLYMFGHWDAGAVFAMSVSCQAVSRASTVVFVWVSRPDAHGMALTRKMNTVAALIAVVCGVGVLVLQFRIAILTVLASVLVIRVIRELFYNRRGGINPLAVSLTQRAVELTAFLVAVLAP